MPKHKQSASEIAESLADPIVTGALPEEQPRLIDHVVSELDRFVTEKRRAGLGARDSDGLPPELLATLGLFCRQKQ